MLDFIKQGTDRSVAVKKNIVGSLFVKGCSIIISLLIVPLTLGYVSSDLYGIWLTLSSIIMWLNFFDIGFTLGLKNKLTEAIALGDMQRGKVLVSTTYFMMIAIFIPLCILLEMCIPCHRQFHFIIYYLVAYKILSSIAEFVGIGNFNNSDICYNNCIIYPVQ